MGSYVSKHCPQKASTQEIVLQPVCRAVTATKLRQNEIKSHKWQPAHLATTAADVCELVGLRFVGLAGEGLSLFFGFKGPLLRGCEGADLRGL